MKNIIKALLEAQSEMENAKKDSINPFFKSKYADLNSVREACMPILNDKNIVVLQPMVVIDGKNYIKTLLLHDSGESIDGLTEIIYSKQNDAQAQGSGITYARRYGLQSLVNIGADDDDGNRASAATPVKKALVKKKQFQKGGFEGALKADKEAIERVLKNYELTDSQRTVLTAQLNKL